MNMYGIYGISMSVQEDNPIRTSCSKYFTAQDSSVLRAADFNQIDGEENE